MCKRLFKKGIEAILLNMHLRTLKPKTFNDFSEQLQQNVIHKNGH